jgi:hypothetical protein
MRGKGIDATHRLRIGDFNVLGKPTQRRQRLAGLSMVLVATDDS